MGKESVYDVDTRRQMRDGHGKAVEVKAKKLDLLGRSEDGVIWVEAKATTRKVGEECGVNAHEKGRVGMGK